MGKKKGEALEKELRLRREAKDLASETGMDPAQALSLTKQLQAARDKIEKLPTGSIKDRREARSKERDDERQRKRDEAVQEAARKREDRKRERERDKLDPNKEDQNDLQKEADRVRREAKEREDKARQDLNKNMQEQTKIQQSILDAFKNLAAA